MHKKPKKNVSIYLVFMEREIQIPPDQLLRHFLKKISTQHAKSVAKSPVIIIIGRAFEATEYFYNEFVTVCFLIMFDTKINQPSPFILFPYLPFSLGRPFLAPLVRP